LDGCAEGPGLHPSPTLQPRINALLDLPARAPLLGFTLPTNMSSATTTASVFHGLLRHVEPKYTPWLWLAPLLVAFVVGVLMTPVVIRLAKRYGVIDQPIGAKIHLRPTPLLGGVAVYVAFLVACLLFLPIVGPIRGILIGGAVAVAVGVTDDRLKLSPLPHLAGQILAAVVAIVFGLGGVTKIDAPFASAAQIANGNGGWVVPAWLGVLFALFWLVGMMNTFNFVDGLDGLSSGVGIISAIMLAWWAAIYGGSNFGHADLVLPLILAGALLGFLPYNWHPAKIFIGDAGAMFVGLGLGAMWIFDSAKVGTALIVLSIPILDVAWAIVRRQMHGKSFLTGDKQHVYHRMIELGLSQTATVLVLYSLLLVLGVIDLALTRSDKLIAFVVIAMLIGAAFIGLEIAGNRRQARAANKEHRRKLPASGS
jgi:UDP-GlcNAc:undecaprenyl-phosphate GlcNAc-1-phosphate transferase